MFLVAGVATNRSVRWTKDRWYQELLRHPHAAERKGGRGEPDHLFGQAAWSAVAEQKLMGAHFTVCGLRLDGAEPALAKRKWDVVVLALLARVAIRERLGSEDVLQVYTDRLGNSSGAVQGRVEALGASLRWVLPAKQCPTLIAEAWAKDPNHLIGVGLTDLYLYNVGRRLLDREGDWPDLAQSALEDMGLADHADLLELPDLDDPAGLQAMMSVQTGRLHRVDWQTLLSGPLPDLARHLREGLCRLPPYRRNTAAASALEGIAPYAEDAGRAERAGVGMDAVLDVLRGLAAQADEGSRAHPATFRRHAYLAARAWLHAGRPDRAERQWSRWDGAMKDEPVHPALLGELLSGMNARAVALTDLERWDEVESLTEAEESLVEGYLGAFECVPALGRALGARYQARILSRRHLDSIFDLIQRSMDQFSSPADASFGLSWRLVALGRGARCADPVALVADTLSVAESLGWGAFGLDNGFLAWGLVEALSVEGVAADLPDAAALARKNGDALLHAVGERPPHPLQALTLRGLGAWTGQEAYFDAAVRGCVLTASALRSGDMAPRLALRTLATWYGTTGSAAAKDALRTTRIAVGREAHLLGSESALAAVRHAVTGFLGFDLSDPAAAMAWVAEGGT